MESFVQKLAKKKEPQTITILPVLQPTHGADCQCGGSGCGCADEGEGGCCGG